MTVVSEAIRAISRRSAPDGLRTKPPPAPIVMKTSDNCAGDQRPASKLNEKMNSFAAPSSSAPTKRLALNES